MEEIVRRTKRKKWIRFLLLGVGVVIIILIC